MCMDLASRDGLPRFAQVPASAELRREMAKGSMAEALPGDELQTTGSKVAAVLAAASQAAGSQAADSLAAVASWRRENRARLMRCRGMALGRTRWRLGWR